MGGLEGDCSILFNTFSIPWVSFHLPIAPVSRVAQDVACGLAHLHGQGLAHCDVKPENILLFNGTAKLSDFGLSLGECGMLSDWLVYGAKVFCVASWIASKQLDISSFKQRKITYLTFHVLELGEPYAAIIVERTQLNFASLESQDAI